jgi:hypothetical protein
MKFAPALTIQLGKSINHSGKLIVSKNKVVLQRLNIGAALLSIMNTVHGFDVLEGLLVQHRRFRRNALVGPLLYDEIFFFPPRTMWQ